MQLADYVIRAAANFPEKTALLCETEQINYKDLNNLLLSFCGGLLSLGLQPGERVAILLNNSIEYVASYFGTMQAGLVAVPLNRATTAKRLAYVLHDCNIRAIVFESGITGLVESALTTISLPVYKIVVGKEIMQQSGKNPVLPWNHFLVSGEKETTAPPRDPEEIAVILYTSGTTGDPKGVMLSHRNLISNTESIISYLHLEPDDRVMSILSFNYSYGNSLLLTHMATGGSVVVDNRFAFPNVVLQRMLETEVTGFSGVPSTFAFLLHKSMFRKMKFPKLRYVTQAGGAMPPAVIKELQKVLPKTKIYIMYGQTEAGARLSYLEPENLKKKLGSIGKAIPGVRLRVLKPDGTQATAREVGEIVAEGDNIMMGYWDSETETAKVLKEGRLYTGDLAWQDEEGFFYIVGRKKDIIKCAAYRISPKELEDLLMASGFLVEVAVIGVEDELLGEAIKVCAVLEGGRQVTAEDIINYCKANLAPYKIPKYVSFYDTLPKTHTGKIKKDELKKVSTPVSEVPAK